MRSGDCGILISLLFLPVWVAPVAADTIETDNGTRIVGEVDRISDGKIFVETEFAGLIAIQQSRVASIVTDKPVAVRLINGDRLEGALAGPSSELQISAATGSIVTPLNQVAASWRAGMPDPDVAAPQRHWAYEATVDMTGKFGNQDQLGWAYGFRATYTRPRHVLVFSTSYNRQTTGGTKSADQLKAGADYTNIYFAPRSWYARDEGGFDNIRQLNAYNTAAAGAGYDFVREVKQTLTGRLGLAFRYENYRTSSGIPDVNTLGLDLGLNFTRQFDNSKLVSQFSLVPNLENFADFRLVHESYYDLPLARSFWKLRVGFANDYNSRTAVGIEKLDTTYYARLVLNWSTWINWRRFRIIE